MTIGPISGGESRLHLIHLFGDLHADDVDLLTPRELQKEVGAVGGGVGVEAFDSRKGRQNLLDGFGDLLLDLRGVRVGVGDLHASM